MSVDTYAVYLHPRGALGSRVNSGTLFGAICWAIRTLGLADLPALLEDFNADPPFVLSSPFPCLRRETARVRFYPMPCLAGLSSAQVRRLAGERAQQESGNHKLILWDMIKRAKRLKKTAYVSEAVFREIVTGQTDLGDLLRRWKEVGLRPNEVEHSERMLLTTGERKSLGIAGKPRAFIKNSDVQRNHIDRVAGATAEGLLFFEEQTFMRRGLTGLWFVLRTRDLGMMQAALRYVADTGIGGRRTSGKGQFDIEIAPARLSLPRANEPNAFVTLSLYLPTSGDWKQGGEPLAYQLVNWRGKHESRVPTRLAGGQRTQPVYKELLRLFAPGSIFPLDQQRHWYGQIAQVGRIGDRSVWHNGLALPVFARIGGG